jgi:hypothetical protein
VCPDLRHASIESKGLIGHDERVAGYAPDDGEGVRG